MAKNTGKKSMSGEVEKVSPIELTTKHIRWEMAVLFRMQRGQKCLVNASVPAFGHMGSDILLFVEDDEVY